MKSWFSFLLLVICTSQLIAATQAENTYLFYGNSMVERLLEQGGLEARLQLAQQSQNKPPLQIRSLAWTGDEVGYRLRPEGYVRHLTKVLNEWPANTIILGYGLNEAFAGEQGIKDFKQQYRSHIKQLASIHKGAKFILISPIALEVKSYPVIKEKGESCVTNCQCNNSTTINNSLKLYTNAISEIAQEYKAQFIDIYTMTQQAYQSSEKALTTNGIHLNDNGNSLVASIIAQKITNTKLELSPDFHELSKAAAKKHHYVSEIIRPKNSVVYFGVRQRPDEYLAEMPRYYQLVAQAEANIYQLLSQPQLKFSDLTPPSLPPLPAQKGKAVKKGFGIIKSPSEAMAEFTVAADYTVNLFASEEEFPELRNPVQISFDAQGRLWVVTMPSFPHTVPGLPYEDKILILEDTDKDGKADKSTVFAEGFDALDGVTFHHNGVIVSAQPKHILMQDTNGDSVADIKQELIRGIDMTDSHHGGMLAADPFGGIIFSDGVFHRSQFETPYGVHRGIDSSTYRLNPLTGEIRTEWQSAIPNPWQPVFDRWGNNYQMYGDGIVVDPLMLTWSPLGVYHPFGYGRILGYGKGSGTAIISSSNFPEEYQQGIASASLLGKYTVSITKTNFDNGPIKGFDRLDLVSSPNAAFRPASLAFGMDGGLYISDFCSPIIGHAQHPMRDPNWDHQHGRIWRVTYNKNSIDTNFPTIQGATPLQLCHLLTHDNDLVRYHTRIELRKHGQQAIDIIGKWINNFDENNSLYEQAALETIFVCEGLGKTQPQLLQKLLQSKSHMYRSAAIHALRLQADRLTNPTELLTSVLKDPHPRVQMEVVDAIAHIQKYIPTIIELAKNISDKKPQTKAMLEHLKFGTEPHKDRSVPVLSVDEKSKIQYWQFIAQADEVQAKNFILDRKQAMLPGIYRTFIYSEIEQPAILGTQYNYINVNINGVRLLSDNERWSKDQQVVTTLKSGLNIIEFELTKDKNERSAVYLYNPLGEVLSKTKVASDNVTLDEFIVQYEAEQAKSGNAIRIQAVPHQMKFSPEQVTVKAGSEVRLIFENPDSMLHNLILINPGTTEVIGALADTMAGQADGMDKAYIPESNDVLYATQLVNPNSQEELVFTAPSTPGRYPYLCTFPGHWRVMHGILIVE